MASLDCLRYSSLAEAGGNIEGCSPWVIFRHIQSSHGGGTSLGMLAGMQLSSPTECMLLLLVGHYGLLKVRRNVEVGNLETNSHHGTGRPRNSIMELGDLETVIMQAAGASY